MTPHVKLVFLYLLLYSAIHTEALWSFERINSGIERAKMYGKRVSEAIKSPFKSEINSVNVTVEHGNLDSYGRNIVFKIIKPFQSENHNKSKNRHHGVVGKLLKHVLIVPGTKWCGAGNKARNDDDLGTFADSDRCCRQHDGCGDFILQGEVKYGLMNTGLFCRSECSCDEEFYDCLKKVNNIIAVRVGVTYFNILGPQCFRKAYPAQCVQMEGNKCVEYSYDTTKEEIYQWFDNPEFL